MTAEDDDPVRALWGEDAERIEARLRAVDPDLAELILDVAYRRVFARPGLDLRTKELLAVAHLMAVGSEGEIRTHLRAALRQGATVDELREVILHGSMFVGFPRALAAMRAWAAEAARAGAESS